MKWKMVMGVLATGFIASVFAVPMPPVVADRVVVPEAVPYAPFASVRDAVKDECELGEKVSKYLVRYADNVAIGEPDGHSQYIEMEITNTFSRPGGGMSGSKWMEVTGTLKAPNGDRLASFRSLRVSGGGLFGEYKPTCSILGRCARAIAKDISRWLQSPRDGAKLGDAH